MPPELQLLVILVAFVGFWFILIRPTRNAQRRTQELQSSLQVGDRVIISAGIFGTITSLDGERVGLEIAPGTVVTVARQAVVRSLDQEGPDGTDRTGAGPALEDRPDDRPDDQSSADGPLGDKE